MVSNLPPGCRPSDLPGERPEDEAFDYFFELYEEELATLTDAQIEEKFQRWWREVCDPPREIEDPSDWLTPF